MSFFLRYRLLWLHVSALVFSLTLCVHPALSFAEEFDTKLYAEVSVSEASGAATLRKTPSEMSDPLGELCNGTLLTFEQEQNGWAYIQTGSVSGYLPLEQTQPVLPPCSSAEPCYLIRMGLPLGYAEVKALSGSQGAPMYSFSDDSGEVCSFVPDGEILLLVRDLGEWSQVQFRYMNMGFVRSDLLKPILIPAFRSAQGTIELCDGTYEVGPSIPPDVYCFGAIGEGKASIEITGADNAYTRRYEAEGNSFYNLYLPSDARVRIEGGGLLAGMCREFLWFTAYYGGTEYTGSGRFLLNANYDGPLHIELAAGETEGYYAVSTIVEEDGPMPERIPVLPGQAVTVEVPQGGFIELRNCHIQTNG